MNAPVSHPPIIDESAESLGVRVRRAVMWRSGSQIIAQAIQWAATFTVIRLLQPSDYGLFAMTQVVIILLNMLDGFGLASGLIQKAEITRRDIRQLFGMLILLNVGLAIGQWLLAPIAAAYYHVPAVATMLRVQALLHLTTPFIAMPYALLSRRLDFRHQAAANLTASLLAALASLAAALAGWGAWTLVAAPLVLFTTRAIMLTASARWLVWPSFDFRGSGQLARFGGVVAVGQLFWFAQSQADVFIAGHRLTPDRLGLYTTGLFLTQIFVAKLVPPLNEVAFSAYARLEGDGRVAAAFAKSVRLVMTAAMPFYLGLFASAEPLVLTALGPRWADAVPIVRLLALAMPFVTLQALLTPACDARGRPGVGVWNGAVGALLLPAAFLVGVRWGLTGMTLAWLAAYPPYLAISSARALPVIGVSFREVARAVAAPTLAALAMAAVVILVGQALPVLPAALRLAILVTVGAATYAGWLAAFARPRLVEIAALIRRRPAG
jgi:O-antigen/teichoic acid export membrane protein